MSDGLARSRRTLAGPTEVCRGVGLHSGSPAWIRIHPAGPGAGISLRDDASGQEIAARAQNVWDTTRCTQLRQGSVTVQTVEHILSALSGLGVDDALVETAGGEIPAVDGSAGPFADLIMAAGIADNGGTVEPLSVTEPVELSDGRGGSIRISPADGLRMTVALEYPNHAYLAGQSASFDPSADVYADAVAPARTFGFLAEIEQLHARGLALGATMENALVLGDDTYVNDVRFENELARHKLLDMIGDLSLIGRPLAAHVSALRPGHELNVKMAVILAAHT